MKIEQLYTGCLAQGAYYIENGGEAAIIDPLREVQQYIDMAAQRGAKIKYIFETHFHADFVSGHVDLARKTGAPIIYGPTTAKTGFDVTIAHDGQQFKLGNATITLIHTPGHTMESSCYLFTNQHGNHEALFTGDTLFIGDVGRPDLAQHVVSELTEQKLASMMYYSLREKIMPLPDHVIVYPAHGAGSACGKKMSNETSDTLGNQKKNNYALRPETTEEEFVKELITGLTPPPGYFPKNVLMNIQGYDSIDHVIERGATALPVDVFVAKSKQPDVLVLDTRSPQSFANGFIPGSINIGINGSFAVWVGTLIKNIKQPIIFVADAGKEQEVVIRLARVGYDNTLGYLQGGFEAWKKHGLPTDSIQSVSVDKFAQIEQISPVNVLDVRKKSEYESEHLLNATNLPLDYIEKAFEQIEKEKTYYIHCAGGYRSMIFASILKSKGYRNVIDVAGGFSAIKKYGKFNVTEYVCPTTLL